MVQLLLWSILIGMVVAVGALWFLFYPSGRLPKWLLWLLTTGLMIVGLGLFGAVYSSFQWGAVMYFALLGVIAGAGGALWAEWPSVKRRLKRRLR